MRVFSAILLTYVLLLLVVPTVCNSMTTCSKEQSSNKKTDKDNSACNSCCYVQNCNCNFTGIQQFNFQIQAGSDIEKNSTQKDKPLSSYLSECWHPPKLI